jgi:hypothetical protein
MEPPTVESLDGSFVEERSSFSPAFKPDMRARFSGG